jgi:predicted nicotinamide N-methyase
MATLIRPFSSQGSGLGLSSIVTAKMGANVTATDGDEDVIPLLQSNVARNGGNANVVLLPWGQDLPPQLQIPDIVMGSDLVYGEDVGIWKKLIQTLEALSGEKTVIVLAQTSRYPKREKVCCTNSLQEQFIHNSPGPLYKLGWGQILRYSFGGYAVHCLCEKSSGF